MLSLTSLIIFQQRVGFRKLSANQFTCESVLGKELHKIVDNSSLKHLQIHKDEHCYVVEDNQTYFEGYNVLENGSTNYHNEHQCLEGCE